MTGLDGQWHPGIGDPTALGWATVGAYAFAGILAWRARHVTQSPRVAGTRSSDMRLLARFWTTTLLVMTLLGVNKQLDLQSWFTELARDLALKGEWYDQRQTAQLTFIAALAAGGAVGMASAFFIMRRVAGQIAGALVGLGFLVVFVCTRAASFHHIDALLGSGAVKLNWVLELGGISLVAISALRQR